MKNMGFKEKNPGSHPKWKKYVEDSLISATKAQMPLAVIKIIQSYNLYHPIYDDGTYTIPKSLSTSGDVVNYFIQRTHDEVQALTYYGRGNIYEDIVASQGMSYAVYGLIKQTMAALDQKPVFGEIQSLIKAGDVNKVRIAEILVRSMLSVVSGAGNCHEQSALALQIMQRHMDYHGELQSAINEISVIKAVVDHVYVKFTLKDGSIYICDPWNNFSGKLDDDFMFSPVYAKCVYEPDQVYMPRGLSVYLSPKDVKALHALSDKGVDAFTLLDAVIHTNDYTDLNTAANLLVELLQATQHFSSKDYLSSDAAEAMVKASKDEIGGALHDKSKIKIEIEETAAQSATNKTDQNIVAPKK